MSQTKAVFRTYAPHIQGFLTGREAAAALGMKRQTFDAWTVRKDIPFIVDNGFKYFNPSDLGLEATEPFEQEQTKRFKKPNRPKDEVIKEKVDYLLKAGYLVCKPRENDIQGQILDILGIASKLGWKPLDTVTDIQLKEELIRRGYEVEAYKIEKIFL